MMTMESEIFNALRDIIHEQSGISLSDEKEALVSARVSKRMRALNIGTFKEYLELLQADDSGLEMTALLDVISTNVTSFFRESDHFDFLHEVIQSWRAAGQQRFRFWSAACSTGEEPYSIAMTVHNALGANGRGAGDVKILATDISTRVLGFAKAGLYPANRVEPVPQEYARRYLTRDRTRDEEIYQVSDELRSLISFNRINLNSPRFPMSGPMDIVFCRNVMIYFDNNTRTSLLSEIHRLLKPGGYLLVGHSESLTGLTNGFTSVRPSIYVK